MQQGNDEPRDLSCCEVSQRSKCTYDITFMWNLKYGINDLFMKQRQAYLNIEHRLVVAKWEVGEGMEWEAGVGRWSSCI